MKSKVIILNNTLLFILFITLFVIELKQQSGCNNEIDVLLFIFLI